MNSDHKEVARPNLRDFSFAAGPMKGTKLSYEIVVTYVQEALLAFELHILRFTTENGVFKDAVAGAQVREPLDDGMGGNFAVVADYSLIFDDCIGTYSDILTEFRS
jgi:hypothetical protein